MKVEIKTPEIIFQFSELLKSSELVPEGLEKDNLYLFCEREESGAIVGVVAVETYGNVCLLRSLAVQENKQNRGIARSLLKEAFEYARSVKSYEMYLLTETIVDMMYRYGFRNVHRDKVPNEFLESPFFNGLCSCSCQLMYKNINSMEGCNHV